MAEYKHVVSIDVNKGMEAENKKIEAFNDRIYLKIKEASELFHLNKSITITYGSEIIVKYTIL